MPRTLMQSLIVALLLAVNSTAWCSGITLGTAPSLHLIPITEQGDTSEKHVLYVPSSYYKKLADKTVPIENPFNIELIAQFSGHNENADFKISQLNPHRDITSNIFTINHELLNNGKCLLRKSVSGTDEFSVASGHQLHIKIPLISEYVGDSPNGDDLEFGIEIKDTYTNKPEASISFKIRKCISQMESQVINNSKNSYTMRIDFKANVPYIIRCTNGEDISYIPPNKNNYPVYFKNENGGRFIAAASAAPNIDNLFSSNHINDDMHNVLYTISTTDSKEFVIETIDRYREKHPPNASKKQEQTSSQATEARDEDTEQSATPAAQIGNPQQQAPHPEFNDNLIPNVLSSTSGEVLKIKIRPGDIISIIANSIARKYGVSPQQVLNTIIDFNYNINQEFTRQVSRRSKQKKNYIKCGSYYYSFTSMQPELEISIPLNQLQRVE